MKKQDERRRLCTAVPQVLSLEGRRLLTVTFLQNGDMLSILGDAGANTIQVADNGTAGADNISATGDGASFISSSHVREVVVASYDGNDRVYYTLKDLVANSPRSLRIMTEGGDDHVEMQTGKIASTYNLQVDLGAGNDLFRGAIGGASAAFTGYIAGATGNDTILFSNTADIVPLTSPFAAPPSPASVTISIDGGENDDVIGIWNDGAIRNGSLSAQALGGLGDDKIAVTINSSVLADPAKTADVSVWVEGGAGNDGIVIQQTGSVTRASATTVAQGNDGKDEIHLTSTGSSTGGTIKQTVTGGSGPDTILVSDKGTIDGIQQVQLTGEDGDDRIDFTQTGDLTANAIAQWIAVGGAGNDVMNLNATGKLSGSTKPFSPGVIHLGFDGGAGNDLVTANVNLAAGSGGKVGDSGSPALVAGGAGNDRLTFAVRTKGSFTKVTAKVFGDAGYDVVKRTKATVLGSSTNEVDTGIL